MDLAIAYAASKQPQDGDPVYTLLVMGVIIATSIIIFGLATLYSRIKNR